MFWLESTITSVLDCAETMLFPFVDKSPPNCGLVSVDNSVTRTFWFTFSKLELDALYFKIWLSAGFVMFASESDESPPE